MTFVDIPPGFQPPYTIQNQSAKTRAPHKPTPDAPNWGYSISDCWSQKFETFSLQYTREKQSFVQDILFSLSSYLSTIVGVRDSISCRRLSSLRAFCLMVEYRSANVPLGNVPLGKRDTSDSGDRRLLARLRIPLLLAMLGALMSGEGEVGIGRLEETSGVSYSFDSAFCLVISSW